MINIKEITEKKVWEEFVELFPQKLSPFFQTWNWGEAQKKSGVTVVRLGIFNNGKLLGLSSVAIVRAKRGNFLHLRHGPLLISFEKHFDYLIDYIKKLGIKMGASFIRISPYIENGKLPNDFFRKRGFRDSPIHKMDGEVCYVIDVTKSEEVLLKEMRKSHRYLIRKAQTLDIKIRKSTDLADITIFLQLYKDLSKRKNFVPHKGISEEFEIFTKDNQAVLFLAEYYGKIISGALIIFLPKMAIYHHAATLNEYRNIPSMYLLQWEVIKEVKKRQIPFYNLWGVVTDSDSKRHPWQGLSLFKKGFGGEMEEFVHAQDLPLNFLYWKTYFIDYLTRLMKGY